MLIGVLIFRTIPPEHPLIFYFNKDKYAVYMNKLLLSYQLAHVSHLITDAG